MKAIALYVNLERPNARESALAIDAMAREAGLAATLCDNGGFALTAPPCDLHDAELLVTVGGDGTLLRGARIAHPLGIPIIGVNTGRLGFLTEVEATPEGFAMLRKVLAGDFIVEERVALHATVAGDEQRHFALNEVVVRRGAQARVTPFGVSLNGDDIAHLPSDGIIVATPTGSTAYFLSAGGPIISPDVDALGVVGLQAHTLFSRPLIVPTGSRIEVTCDGEVVKANLETDGVVAADLGPGDRVTIARAPEPVRFARVRAGAFFERLEKKLRWGAPIKR